MIYIKENISTNDLYVYHATDSNNIKSILSKGLLSKPPFHSWEGMYTEDGLFLALDASVAEDYAENSDSEPEEIVVLKIRLSDLDPNCISYDWNNRCEYADDINSFIYAKNIPPQYLEICDVQSEPGQNIYDFRYTDLFEILLTTFDEECETNLEWEEE